MSRIPWGAIAALGALMSALAVAPYVFRMAALTSRMSMENHDPVILEQSMNLMVGALFALIPLTLGGIILFVIFQIAEMKA